MLLNQMAGFYMRATLTYNELRYGGREWNLKQFKCFPVEDHILQNKLIWKSLLVELWL